MGLDIILPGVVLLGIVIFVHELGHFLAAKGRGVKVLKFSLGMGPEMVGFTRGETRYCLSWIPLGGFVQMAGDHLEPDGSLPEGGREQFLTHPWFGRVVIALAGPAANLVCAFVVLVSLYTIGFQQPDWPNRLGPIADTTAAYAEGVRSGDTLVSLGGHPIRTWRDLEAGYRDLDRALLSTLELSRAGTPVRIELSGERMKRVVDGLRPPLPPAEVGYVSLGLPAYRAGIKEGDRILSVADTTVETFADILRLVRGSADKPLVFKVDRAGKVFDVTITPMRMDESAQGGRVGIEAPRGLVYVMRLPFHEAVVEGLLATGRTTAEVYRSLWLTIMRPVYYRESVGGPILIAQMAAESARRGFDYFLNLMAVINLAVMSFNLLPVPLLDGGHITLAVLEGVRRRRISGRAYMNFQKVGLVLVGTLFVFILSKDIIRPFQRLRAIDQAPRESSAVEPARR